MTTLTTTKIAKNDYVILKLYKSYSDPKKNWGIIASGFIQLFDQSPRGRIIRFSIRQSVQWDGTYKIVKFDAWKKGTKIPDTDIRESITVDLIRALHNMEKVK